MASPATRITPSIPKPHRKPLQSKNFPANLTTADTAAAINPKKPNLTIEEQAGKENLKITNCNEKIKLFSENASLGDELDVEKLRTKQHRQERERGEAKMRKMDTTFERWMRVAERRLNELLVVEMDIQRVVRAKKHRASCLKSSALISLRAREERKRWQEKQEMLLEKKDRSHLDPRKTKCLVMFLFILIYLLWYLVINIE